MLDALILPDQLPDGSDTDPDSPMDDSDSLPGNPFLLNHEPEEATLESHEAHKYLLAKSYFDTREYDRCSAVFLAPAAPAIPTAQQPANARSGPQSTAHKGKERHVSFGSANTGSSGRNPFPRMSQKSLFLALYAKYLAGEKRRDEETEMILGPADGGMTVNRELPWIAKGLEGYFAERREKNLEARGQGWLEYLYGVVLLKAKNEEEAKKWLIKSVHLYPFNWGAWQELNDLLANADDVRLFPPRKI
jgi:anaphase-promoting complex subunit 8